MIRSFARLPVSTVAMTSLFPGIVLSLSGSPEWRELGRDEVLFSIVPLVLWAFAGWRAARQETALKIPRY